MAVLLADYVVLEPTTFATIFDEFQVVRDQHGSTAHRLLHDKHDPAHFIVTIDFPSEAAARSFAEDPRRVAALKRATVAEHTEITTDEVQQRS
jgi:uncharacterized protein (DUF1330 family)